MKIGETINPSPSWTSSGSFRQHTCANGLDLAADKEQSGAFSKTLYPRLVASLGVVIGLGPHLCQRQSQMHMYRASDFGVSAPTPESTNQSTEFLRPFILVPFEGWRA
jgi:hypothetical protein